LLSRGIVFFLIRLFNNFRSLCRKFFLHLPCALAINAQTISFDDYYHTRLEFGNRAHDLSDRKWSSRGYVVVPGTNVNNRWCRKIWVRTIERIYRQGPVAAFCPHTRYRISLMYYALASLIPVQPALLI